MPWIPRARSNQLDGYPVYRSLGRAGVLAIDRALQRYHRVVAFTACSERHSLWSSGACSNRFLVGAVASSLVLLVAVVYLPGLTPIFHTVALTGHAWLS